MIRHFTIRSLVGIVILVIVTSLAIIIIQNTSRAFSYDEYHSLISDK